MRWRGPRQAGRPARHHVVTGASYSGDVTAADETFLDLALSRSSVDRSAQVRIDPSAVRSALADPGTRVLPLQGTLAPVLVDPVRLGLRSPQDGDADAGPGPWFLGVRQGVRYLAVQEAADRGSVPQEGPAGTGGPDWRSLREIGAELDDTDAGVLTTATALVEWHGRHAHCPRCGALTEVVQAGWVRRCPQDGSEHHPRTDPAIIVAVTDPDDRLLLATGLPWPEGRVSVLAGFVEAGESLEAAVVREVQEEVGIPVDDLRYRGNQPWPFPASLMFAFAARSTQTALVVQESELREAGWYTREELHEGVRGGRLSLPSRVSIAHRLIQEWFGAPLPGSGPAVPR